MNLARRMAIAASPLLLGACVDAAEPTFESQALAEVVNVTSRVARGTVGADADGPLMIDVASFARQGPGAVGARVTEHQVDVALRTPHRDAGERFAVRCWYPPHSCHVWRDGAYVRMDSVVRGRAGAFSAFVTCIGTDHHGRHELLSMTQLRIEVRRVGGRWLVSEPSIVWIT